MRAGKRAPPLIPSVRRDNTKEIAIVGLFSQKPRVSIKEFCKGFYDEFIFPPNIGEVNPWEAFGEMSYKMVLGADPTFKTVSLSSFTAELRTLRLEVFGIAWFHNVKDKHAPAQSEFTKHYLEEHGFTDIWESLEDYNKAVARSTTGGHDPDTRLGRASIVFLNQMRSALFDEWVQTVSDPKNAARAANRIGSHVSWKSMRAHSYLSFALTDRMQCEVNEEARTRIVAIIQGLYDGASEAIKAVKIIA